MQQRVHNTARYRGYTVLRKSGLPYMVRQADAGWQLERQGAYHARLSTSLKPPATSRNFQGKERSAISVQTRRHTTWQFSEVNRGIHGHLVTKIVRVHYHWSSQEPRLLFANRYLLIQWLIEGQNTQKQNHNNQGEQLQEFTYLK
jgi:hypothetical protein